MLKEEKKMLNLLLYFELYGLDSSRSPDNNYFD